ncbi:MAG: hypothetical protein FWH16_05385, partial [Oscillospiraceae bacterium]|nr:hypothetical protein [Oscillospiraceae bacterium]
MRINWTPPNNEQPVGRDAHGAPNPAAGDIAHGEAPPSAEGVAEHNGPQSEAAAAGAPRPARAVIDRAVNIEEVIKAFKLPDTPAVRALIAEMARGGVELSHENIDILSRASEAFPELRPEQIVFMAREEILINPENVGRFQQFLTHKNLIGEQLTNILNQLPDSPAPPAADGAAAAGTPPSPEAPHTNVSRETSPAAAAAAPQATENITQSPQTADIASGGTPPPSPEMSHSNVSRETAPAAAAAPQAAEGTARGGTPQTVDIASVSTPPSPEAPRQNVSRETLPAAQAMEGTARDGTPPPSPEMPHSNVSRETSAAAPQAAEGTAQPPQTVDIAGDSTPPPSPELSLSNVSRETAPAAPQTTYIARGGTPQTVEQKIASLFRKVDPHSPHRLPGELNARELARELDELIEAVRHKLPELAPRQREALARSVNELEQSVKFLDGLNRFTPIVNVPLQWGDRRTTAELYVFNDSGRGRKIDPHNATVFISLMTANTGRV